MLTFLGFSGTGYFIARYTNEQRFNNAAVQEAIRLLSANTQIVELIGYPIGLVSTVVGNRAIISDQGSSYFFLVRGPRGRLNISLSTEIKSQAEINNPTLAKEFYLPDNELKLMMEELKTKEGEAVLEKTDIPKNQKFWKIKSLVVDLAPDYQINIVNPNEKKENELPKLSNSSDLQENEKSRQFLIEVYREERKRKGTDGYIAKSEEEIEEIRQFKLRETYRKVGYVRFYLFMIAVFGAMGTYIYLMKNKRKKIQGSEIQYIMQQFIFNNHQIKSRFGENLKFVQTSRGSIIDKTAEFEQDFLATKAFGTVFTKGTYQEKTNTWKIDSIKVGIKNKKGEISDIQKLI